MEPGPGQDMIYKRHEASKLVELQRIEGFRQHRHTTRANLNTMTAQREALTALAFASR